MRVYTYMVIMAGMIVLLTLLGYGTGLSKILVSTGLLTAPENFNNSEFYLAVKGVMTLVAVGSIFMGLFSKSGSESFLIGGMAVTLLTFILDIKDVLIKVAAESGDTVNWIYYAAALILIPFMIGYGVSILEWWRGSD